MQTPPSAPLPDAADRSPASVRRHAEEPAASGDFAGALARWREADEAGLHPLAPLYVARYLALSGQIEEARAALADYDWRNAAPTARDMAVTKFYVKGLEPVWIEAAHALRAANETNAALDERLCRAGFLFDLDATRRTQALDLLNGASPDVLRAATAQAKAQLLAFVCAFDEPRAAAFAEALDADETVRVAAIEHASKQVRAKRLAPLDALQTSARMYGVTETRTASKTDAEHWQAEYALAAADPQAPPTAIGVTSARDMGEPALAIARKLVTRRDDLSAETATALAAQMDSASFRVEARRLLHPHRGASEKAANAYAATTAKGAPENRTSQTWRAAHAAFPTAGMARGLSGALAEELDYAGAEALLRAVPRDAPRSEHWRALAGFLHRTGQYEKLNALLTEWEAAEPENAWLPNERLRHAMDAADAQTTAGIEDTVKASPAFAQDYALRRSVAGRLEMVDRYGEALVLMEDIKTRTGSASDHFHYAQALFHAGRFDEGRVALDTALQRFPGDYRLHLKAAQAHERFGKYERALASFTRAFAAEPFNLDSCSGVARCLTYLERYDQAEAWLARFPAADINGAWALAARAFNEARRNDPAAAQAALDRLYAIAADFMAECERRRTQDPAAIWLEGQFRSHPALAAARMGVDFANDVAAMRAARSLVLMGNSPSLVGSGKGAAIDAADFVIRLNDFQVEGFEADVGRRTDLWYSSANALARPNCGGREQRIWLSQPYAPHYPELSAFARARLGLELTEQTARFLPPHVHILTARLAYPRPTSGFRFIVFLDFFLQREYHLAGFSFFRDGELHYFDRGQERLQVGEVHAVEFERDFVHDVLARSRHLRWL